MRAFPVRHLATSALLSVLALHFGCKTANTYSTGEPESNVGLRRVVRDPLLNSDLVITASRIDARAGGKLGQITVRNDGAAPRSVELKWAWLDASGVNISGYSEWLRQEVQPGEVRDFQSAGSRDATDFRVTVRPAQN